MKKTTMIVVLIALATTVASAYYIYVQDNDTDTSADVIEKNTEETIKKDVTEEAQKETQTSNTTSTGEICGTVLYIPGAQGFESRPFATNIEVINSNGVVVASTKSNSDGYYRVGATFGSYTVTEKNYGTSVSIKVTSNGCNTANISISAPSSTR